MVQRIDCKAAGDTQIVISVKMIAEYKLDVLSKISLMAWVTATTGAGEPTGNGSSLSVELGSLLKKMRPG